MGKFTVRLYEAVHIRETEAVVDGVSSGEEAKKKLMEYLQNENSIVLQLTGGLIEDLKWKQLRPPYQTLTHFEAGDEADKDTKADVT